MLKYSLHTNGRINQVGFDDSLPIIANGSEPWFNNWDTESFKWQFVAGEWSVWYDQLNEGVKFKIAISDTPLKPNIGRNTYVRELVQDLFNEQLTFTLLIRHYRKLNLKDLLEYDQLIVVEVDNIYLITDPVTLQPTGAFNLFKLRLQRDNISYYDVIVEFINYFDQLGVINGLIEIY